MKSSFTEQYLEVSDSPDGSKIYLDLAEFDCLCILFDKIFEDIQDYDHFLKNSGNVSSLFRLNEKDDLDNCLDEFDLAEINRMIEFYELHCYHDQKIRHI
jgi:hypothetical protein